MSELDDLAQRYTAAWCSQNAAKVAACYSPNGSLRINDGAPAVGQAAITEVARGFMTTFPDLQVLMDLIVVEDERIEYHWTLIGTSGGRRVRISGLEQWKIGDDGLIAESRGSFDNGEYQRQLESGCG